MLIIKHLRVFRKEQHWRMYQLCLRYFYCNSGFYLKGTSCVKTVKNCVKFSDAQRQVCTDCAQGYSLHENYCVMNSVLGCKNEVDHVCKECFKPFTLNNGNCEIQHCKSYNDFGCVACNCGYYLNKNGMCKVMEGGCIRYHRGECIDCLPAYTLKGNECQIEGCEDIQNLKCTRCSEGYDLLNGGCSLKNCEFWKEGVCQKCKGGYRLMNGVCSVFQNLTFE